MASLLDDPAYKKLAKDPVKTDDRKTATHIKKVSLPECVAEELWPHGSRLARLYWLQKIHKSESPPEARFQHGSTPAYGLAKYLMCLLSSHLSLNPLLSCDELDRTLSTHSALSKLAPRTSSISFFTRVLLKDALNLLSQHFDENILRLFHYVLMSSFFCFNGQFYEQTDGVAMGSPMSPVIFNLFMEVFD
jgi:hypothetical protein